MAISEMGGDFSFHQRAFADETNGGMVLFNLAAALAAGAEAAEGYGPLGDGVDLTVRTMQRSH